MHKKNTGGAQTLCTFKFTPQWGGSLSLKLSTSRLQLSISEIEMKWTHTWKSNVHFEFARPVSFCNQCWWSAVHTVCIILVTFKPGSRVQDPLMNEANTPSAIKTWETRAHSFSTQTKRTTQPPSKPLNEIPVLVVGGVKPKVPPLPQHRWSG